MSFNLPPAIYHYTDQNGIMGIFGNKELWASNALFLNDSDELYLARNLFVEALQNRASKLSSSSLTHIAAEYLNTYLNGQEILNHTFVCSFSSKFDDLNQWRSYSGKTNGYMLGFNSEALHGLTKKYTHKTWSLIECIYSRQQQDNLISSIIERFEADLDGVFPYFGKGEINENYANQLASNFANVFTTQIAPAFKNPCFSDENEWRLVYTVPFTNHRQGEIKYRSGKSAITPYVPFKFYQWKFSEDSPPINPFISSPTDVPNKRIHHLTSIMIRPHLPAPFVVDGFKSYIESLGLEPHLVTKSALPYRSY